MRAVAIPRFGGPDVLEVVSVPMPQPGQGEVLIRVAAAGLNNGDLVQRRGNYPPPPGASDLPGLEVSGVVEATGPGVTRWSVGQPVCAILAGGGYAEYCVAPEGQCLPVPKGIALVDAAALPEAICTVWDAVWFQARLAPGESLLVHGGTSGIGVAAVQLAAALGNPVYVTAGTREKCDTAMGLGAAMAVNYREEDFVPLVRDATAGNGVDVILDMVGGAYLARNVQALANDGRLVVIGLQSPGTGHLDVPQLLRRRLTIIGTTLRARSTAYKARLCGELQTRVWPLLEAGKLRPVVDRVFALEDAASAHRHMESGRHQGKILLAVNSVE